MKYDFRLIPENESFMSLIREGKEQKSVRAKRCFPWSYETGAVSLMDEDGEEVELVRDLEYLEPGSQKTLKDFLRKNILAFEILEVISIIEEFEIRKWKVRTDRGERSFYTKISSWPESLASGGFLIKDLWGDAYRVAELDSIEGPDKDKLISLVD